MIGARTDQLELFCREYKMATRDANETAPTADRDWERTEEIDQLRRQLREERARSELRRVLLLEARAFILESQKERRQAVALRSSRVDQALQRYRRWNAQAPGTVRIRQVMLASFMPGLRLFSFLPMRHKTAECQKQQCPSEGRLPRADLERHILQNARRYADGIEAIILEVAKRDAGRAGANWRLAGVICGRSDHDDALAAAQRAARFYADCLVVEDEM